MGPVGAPIGFCARSRLEKISSGSEPRRAGATGAGAAAGAGDAMGGAGGGVIGAGGGGAAGRGGGVTEGGRGGGVMPPEGGSGSKGRFAGGLAIHLFASTWTYWIIPCIDLFPIIESIPIRICLIRIRSDLLFL